MEEDPPVDVWPEHELPLLLISRMSTQLNVGAMGGVIGYRYEALPVVFRGLMGSEEAWPDVFKDFQELEREVVRLINERIQHG